MVTDEKDSFGFQALTTLLEMMESYREDLVVILAGYPKEMDKLLDLNPGFFMLFAS